MPDIWNNDEAKAFFKESGYPYQSYNDGLLAYLRDIFQSDKILPDLLNRYLSTYGNEIMAGSVIERKTTRTAIIGIAATFTNTTPTSASGGTRTTLTSAGAHGLTAAVAVTPGNVYLPITAGTGWTPGLYLITGIDLDTTGVAITIDYPFDAGLGTPTISLVNTEIPIHTVTIPELTPNAFLELDTNFGYTNSGNNKITRIRFGGTSGTIYHGLTLTTTVLHRALLFIQNRNNVASQMGAANAATTTGVGTGGAAFTTSTVDTSTATTLVYSGIPAVANEIIAVDRAIIKLTL